MGQAEVIVGSSHVDERGELKFFNNLDMSEIVRFYEIAPSATDVIRAWQAHKKEKKWLYCLSGSFVVNLIKIDDFENPSNEIKTERFIIGEEDSKILVIPGGYANGFRAETKGSKLMVFSNFSISESQKDDFRFLPDQWSAQW